MEQSIASSQENISAGKRLSRNSVSILARLWSAITANRSEFSSSRPQFGDPMVSDISDILNIDKISARLNVEERAEADGRNDRPPSTEEGVSGTQREIVVYFKKMQREAQYKVDDLAANLRGIGEEIDLLGVGASLRDIPSRCEIEVFRLIAESQSELNFLGERETQQRQRYAVMLEKNQPNQNAGESTSPVIQWIFRVVLIALGAFAFAKISASGFGRANVIPSLSSISISLIVVLASSAVAHAVSRSAGDTGQIRQMAGWLGNGLGIALIVMMALFAAQYIAAVMTDPAAAIRSVIDSILIDPIAFVTDVANWKAFGVAFSVGLMAFLVSYRFGSSYPSRGVVQSTIYHTRKKRDRLTKRLRMQINAIIDAADAEVTDLPKQLKKQIRQYSKLVDESKRVTANLSDCNVALEDGCNILLDRYRAANLTVRESQVPMSFSEHICFRPESDSKFSVISEEDGRVEKLRQGIVELAEEAAQVRQKLRELNSLAISNLEGAPVSV